MTTKDKKLRTRWDSDTERKQSTSWPRIQWDNDDEEEKRGHSDTAAIVVNYFTFLYFVIV